MSSLEENRTFVLSKLEQRPRTTGSRRLLSIIAAFQHDIVSTNSYETLRSKISSVTPRTWKEALESIAVLGYRSPLPNAEALSDGDHAGVVVFDGLVALLALLNEALMKSHSAYTNRLLMKLDSALTGVKTGPEQMPGVPRSHKWIEDLLSLLMYWASDLTSEELLPLKDRNGIHSSAQM